LAVPWAKQSLWIVAAHYNSGLQIVGLPSNFTNLVTGIGQGLGTAINRGAPGPMNPSAFTLTGNSTWLALTIGVCPLTLPSALLCKGGTFGSGQSGGAAAANGSTPTGLGGIRFDPILSAVNQAGTATCFSHGGVALFGFAPRITNVGGVVNGSASGGFGGGGNGGCHQNTTTASGGAGAPGMILIEGYGLDA
jgi:hypothetical protein